ncbi:MULTISPECIES: hypothetical protein [Bacillus]|uniref:hypothetical protein n=1 Tax=Bacillus TaxID=1386 RepID=UPI0002D89F9F|nr:MULTISPECIES: hypothetical protein [Bacillus]KUL16231.1 hypothetical protein LI6934_16785 [Bacillus licheniformis LMG 6934]MCU4667622.1 hypothetical protein [Bacillus paralicheniformis]MED0806619.1 hypothetical protein [Bacillus paralicheniformis]TWJ81716.1 hypothetical protein CHCC5019_4211 [Bacillus paralicheniformis]TWK54830.1 hypothetical protein CHCC20343_1488 [Bacillus licheniformis]
MITAFKIILLMIIMISFLSAIAEEEQAKRDNMTAICIASMFSLVVAFIVL